MWTVVGLLGLAGCYPLGTYTCDQDAECNAGAEQGVCQASGFCSYPDGDCDSEQRYDNLAGSGLAGECVEAPGESTGTTSSSSSSTVTLPSTTSSTSPESSSSSGSGEDTGELPVCIDMDEDGFGIGCAGPDCDDDNPNVSDTCLYISPLGNDAAEGTREAPWYSFARAVGALEPGMSLVLLSGNYEPETTGLLLVDCDAEAASQGTAALPIFVRADEERQAHIRTGGQDEGIRVQGCSHWQLRGLTVIGQDFRGGIPRAGVRIHESSEVALRRVLVATDNRHASNPLYLIDDSDQVLVEECEAYDFTATAFWSSTSTNTTFRRVYANSRGRADLAECGQAANPDCSQDIERGDFGIKANTGTLVENAIIEDVLNGVSASGPSDLRVFGTAIVAGRFGVSFTLDPDVGSPRGVVIQDVVGVGQTEATIWFRSVAEVSLRSVTSVGPGRGLSSLLAVGMLPCPDGCQLEGANLLSIGAEAQGLSMTDANLGSASFCNSFGPGRASYTPGDEPVDDDMGFWRRSLSVAVPRIGVEPDQCLAYVPGDSVMSGAGERGEDIGANILYRFEGGVLGREPLWDPRTRAFPCGAVVPDINDEPTSSCQGVHERLNVGTPGCPLPAGYPSEK